MRRRERRHDLQLGSAPQAQAISIALNTGSYCNGDVVQQDMISFSLQNSVGCGGKVASFVAFDLKSMSRLFEIKDGSTVCLAANTSIEARIIRASVQGCRIRSVRMRLLGPMAARRVAKGKFVWLLQNRNTVPQSNWPDGYYTVKAIPYGKGDQASKGQMLGISFTNKCL